ncbi:MAG: DUF2281 domain-containing protein [Synechococcales cyanobacterium RM1_1_8]|nr:DUF2281 domain-containing protein [Synechococcales cyanobacterium RM1_1_8]
MIFKILEQLQQLPRSLQQDVFNHVSQLLTRYKAEKSSLKHPPKIVDRSGLLGAWRGKVWMAEDFDAPLEDMAEYM